MKNGESVWNIWRGILRFGVIKSKRKDDDGWMYFVVDWTSGHTAIPSDLKRAQQAGDKAYKEQMRNRKKLSGEDHELTEYRADQIYPLAT